MKVNVKLFARARDLAGSDRVSVELPTGANVGDLRQALGGDYPALLPMLPRLLVAVGTTYATDLTPLREGADVACFPPVSGG